ncbi:MAG TPA: hypothetical protein VFF19_35265 [Reyranella sp.]|nr:hypothetical protein [Reyranella sp.]
MATATASTKQRLSDEDLTAVSPALLTLVEKLEGIASRAPDASVAEGFAALADYFRTPDAL